eukprot:736388-Pelagomonas_calceolata.AAC.1
MKGFPVPEMSDVGLLSACDVGCSRARDEGITRTGKIPQAVQANADMSPTSKENEHNHELPTLVQTNAEMMNVYSESRNLCNKETWQASLNTHHGNDQNVCCRQG